MQNLGKIEKKRGRPATGRDPSVKIRMPLPLLSFIDEQAKRYETGRSDMVRRLIEESSLGVPGELRKLRTAYHEAGHAVIARVLGFPISVATIKPSETSLGHVMPTKTVWEMYGKRREDGPLNNGAWYAAIMFSMAGRLAETELLGFHRSDDGDRGDRKHIRQYGRALFSQESKAKFESLKQGLSLCTEDLIRVKLRHSIKGVAKALLASETIDQKRVDRIITTSGEMTEARRLVGQYWQKYGLTPKKRRKPGAPQRRGSDHC